MEILFKGKTKQGEWAVGFYAKKRTDVGEPQSVIITGTYFGQMTYDEVIPETIGQFTGEDFYDGDGELHKVFVGDVLRVWMDGTEQDGLYIIKDLKTFYEDFEQQYIQPYYRITGVLWVGNIYDNPEFMEGK